MANPIRYPGSREEDAWLSDEQIERCEPAESEPFQGPVPTRMISNGEYMPSSADREAEARRGTRQGAGRFGRERSSA